MSNSEVLPVTNLARHPDTRGSGGSGGIRVIRPGFFVSSRARSSQAHSLVISADWNAYELAEGNDCAHGQTVRRRVVLEM